MAHTLDDLRKLKNGRGTNSASSSDSQGKHTLEELRSLDTRRRPQTTQSTQTATTPSEPIRSDRPEGVSSSWQSHTGNATLDSINNMLSMRKVMQAANATPKNMPTLQTNDEVKDYYESLGNYNAIERLFDKDKAEKYNQKQALKPQYDAIKKEEDLDVLRKYGITDEDLYTAAYQQDYNGQSLLSIDTDKNVDLTFEGRKAIDDKFKKAFEDTGINPYWYLDDYKKGIIEKEADAAPVLTTLNTYAKNPGESLGNVALDTVSYLGGMPIENNPTYTDIVRNRINENIDSEAGRFAYGTVNSIADMGVAMTLGLATGGGNIVSAGTMGVEKASNVMNEAVERGLNPNQIMLEGIASGVTTAATEAIPMGKWEEVARKGFVGLHGKELAKEIASKFIANAIPEGLQEMAEDIADAIADDLIAGDKSEINTNIQKIMAANPNMTYEQAKVQAWQDWTKQMVLDGLGGFISGGVMSGGSIAVGLANPYSRGEVNREALTEKIKGMDTESETYKAYQELSEKRGENLENATEREVSDLFLKAYEEASDFDRTEVNQVFKDELKKHDYSEEEAEETLQAVLSDNPTKYQKSLIDNNLVRDALDKAYNSDEGVAMRLRTSMNQMALEDTVKTTEQVKVEKKTAKAESKINTAEESSVNGEKVEVLGMDIKGGVYVINTDKGTFNADDVKVASSIKDAVAFSVNIKDPGFKEAFVTNYKGQDIDTYEAYAYEAFTAGKNFNASVLEQGNFAEFLGDQAVEDFLDAGRMSVSRSTKESEERSIKAAAEAEGKFQKGTFTSEVDYNSLKSTQKKVYNFLKGMSNIGGLNINVIYNTKTVENGFFQYDAESGGTITVNLAAKARVDEKGIGSTYVIPVLSHELTHYLEKNAENSYMILQKAVFKVLRADGMNIDDEVRSKIEKYKAHNIELTEAEAVHEIIAQACEGMMSNENTMKKALSYMNEREMKTFKKALDKFFSAVKQFVKSLAGGDEIQNRYADAISRNIDEVQDAWAKAFADALKRQQTLNKEVGLKEDMTADNNTTVVGEDYAQFNIQTYEKSLPFLKDWLKKSGLSAKEQKNILFELESKRDMLEAIRKEFPHFDEWSMHDSQEEAIASMGDMDEETEKAMREAVAKYLTAIVNNSEYPYNFDLTTVCKKRQTLNKVLNMLVTDGMFDDFIPDEKTITDLVDTIKANGFEVACALCFVDSKRYRIGSWADSIVNGKDTKNTKTGEMVHSYGWNEIVKSMEVKGKVSVNDFNFLNRDIDNERPYRLASDMTIDELREAGALKMIDKIIATEKGNTRNKKFANAILRNPSIAHTANVAELLSSEGLDIARIKAPDFHDVVNGASGQATPKLSHDAITYENDILRKLVEKSVTPEDLYKVGGFRVQSFSDYVANEIFDYIQMVSELAANEFPSHAYTKEYFFVKLFGMTGMKINMSIVPKAFSDKIREEFKKKYKGWTKEKREADPEYQYYKMHCGLEKGTNKDGSYDWEDPDGTKWHYIIEDESFGAIRNREKNTYDPYAGFKRALEIQSDPRYNKNCGIIWVGVSDAHIRAMMRDKRIPMVIPYHRSSINHLVAEMRAIDSYNDYTPYQVEKRLNGKSFKKETLAKRMADWDFYADLRKTKDPVQTSKNYVKYCLEHKVRPVFYQFAFEEGFEGDYDHFEEGYYKLLTDFRLYGGNTDGTMDTTFAEQGAVTMTFPEEFESLAKESLAEYESDTTYLDENQKKLYEESKKIIEKNKKEKKQMSLQEDSNGNKLTKGQQTYFENSKAVDENGNLLVMYHGSPNAQFTTFERSYLGNAYFFTDDRFVAYGYSGTQKEVNPYEVAPIKTFEDLKSRLEPLGYDVSKEDGNIVISDGRNSYKKKTVKDALEYFIDFLEPDAFGGAFEVYLNAENPLNIDAKDADFNSIESGLFDDDGNEITDTDGLVSYAQSHGYDSIIVDNVFDNGQYDDLDQESKVIVVFNPDQIKSIYNESPTKDADIRYSIQVSDDNGNTYEAIKIDDKNTTKVIKDQSKFRKFVESLAGKTVIVYDKDDKEEIISFAKTNERVSKNGKQHRVLGELAFTTGDTRKATIVHIVDALKVSFWLGDETEHNHTWLDERGWEKRRAYVVEDGIMYSADLRIAKAKDGRNILYAVNLDRNKGIRVDEVTTKGGSVKTGTPSEANVTRKDINDKRQFSLQEDSSGKKLTKGQQNFFKDSKVVDKNGNLLVLYHGTISPGFTKFDTENLIYLTSDRFVAKSFSNASVSTDYFDPNTGKGSIYKLYANIENPLIVDATKTVLSGKYDAKISYDRDTGRYTVELTDKNGKHDYTTYNIGEIFDEKTVGQINDHFDKNAKSPYSIKNKNVLIQSPSYYYDVEFNGEKVGTDDIADYAKKNGYDGVIVNNVIEGGEYSGAATDVIVFDANQVKLADNENPTEDPDIRYSIQEDSNGKELSKRQQTYFKNSKVVDDRGRLKVMYHGTDKGGFTVFNPLVSDDKVSLFFTDSESVAKSYTASAYAKKYDFYSEDAPKGNVGTYEVYLNITDPLVIDAQGRPWNRLTSFKLGYDYGSICVINVTFQRKADGTYSVISDYLEDDNYKQGIWSKEKIRKYFGERFLGILENCPEEVNFNNILVHKGANSVEPNDTRSAALLAKYGGNDGVIIKNTKDYAVSWSMEENAKKPSTIAIAFDSNQVKDVNNENPTKKKDILYSLQEESEIPDDEKATYQTLEDDVKLLRDFTKLAKEDMKWQAKDMNALSEYLIKKYESDIPAQDLKEELANLFNAIPEQTDNWLNVMDACFGLASEIYEVSNNKVKVDANVDVDARQAVAAAKRRNAIQQIAIDIYNKYWTMTSYYTNNEKAKGLKAQHRQNIKNAVEKQKEADATYYKKLIDKTKRRAEEDKAKIKAKTEDKLKAMKESNERKAEIQKIEDQAAMFAKWIRQNSKNHPVPDILKEPLEMLLTSIDPVTREKGKATKKQESLSLSLQKVANALGDINKEMAQTDKPDNENAESGLGMLDIPPYMVKELNEIAANMHELEVNYEVPGAKTLQLMDIDSLKKLKQDMNAIQKAISTANELISKANKERVNHVGQKIINYLAKLPQAKRDALNEKLTRGIDFLTLDNTTPFYFFKHLGEGGSILFDILADGMDDMTNKVEEISDFTEETYTEEDQKKWRNNIREFEILQKLTDTERANGEKEKKVKIQLTDAQIMSLYCLSKRVIDGRHQALEHILRDGIAIGKIDAKKKVARQDTVTITESQLKDIISIVENDEKMKMVADALQHFMSSVCSDWGNKVTYSRWGIKQFTERFYFPIAVNAETKKTDAVDQMGSLFSLLNQDFTKPLQDNVRSEIMVYDIFDVFTKHTSDMARYSALGLPILDTIKVWNYSEAENKSSGNKDEDEKYQQRKVSSVKKSIAKAFGERGGNKYVSTLIKNLNGKADKGVYDNIGMGMMKRYKASKVAASTMTALVQPLSIFRAAYNIDKKYLIRGLAHRPQIDKCFGNKKKGIKANVGVAKWKKMSIGVDTNIGRGVDRIINHQNTFGDKVMDKSLWLAEKMDELTWGYIYNAVEEEIKDTHKDLKPGTKEFDEAVSKRAREVFYSTQIFDSALTRSAFMRDKGYHAVMLSAFMSEPTLSYNMLLDSVTEYYQDAKINGSNHAFHNKGKVVASAISIYVLSSVVESVVREAFTRIRDYDDEDEEFFDGFLKDVIDRVLDELNLLNKLPYTKQLMDGLSAFKSGYSNNNKMDEAFISDIANSYKAIKKAIEREEVTYKTIWSTFNALSDVTGLPFANALREVKMIWNNTIGRATGNYFK